MEYRKIKDEDDHDVASDIESVKVTSSNIAMATLGVGSSERINWKRKGVVTCALTILTSSQAILIVWSKRAGKYEYSVTTANFLVETLKCALSLLALTRIWKNEGVTDDNRLSTTYDEVKVLQHRKVKLEQRLPSLGFYIKSFHPIRGIGLFAASCNIYLSIHDIGRRPISLHQHTWSFAPRVRPAIQDRDARRVLFVDGSANVVNIRTNRNET